MDLEVLVRGEITELELEELQGSTMSGQVMSFINVPLF